MNNLLTDATLVKDSKEVLSYATVYEQTYKDENYFLELRFSRSAKTQKVTDLYAEIKRLSDSRQTVHLYGESEGMTAPITSVQVNWSAFGATNIQQSYEYGQLISEAANIAFDLTATYISEQ